MNRLDKIEARANAATEGPWFPNRYSDDWEVCGELDDNGNPALVASEAVETDAEFIAHARTDVPALVAALYEVLDQHQRVVLPTYLPIGRMEDVSICGVCTVEGEPADWPCPTVTAIRHHLGDDK